MFTLMAVIENKDVKVLWSVIFFVSIIFSIFFLFYGLKSVNGEMCSSDNVKTNPSITNDLIITNTDNRTFFPEYSNKELINHEKYVICLEITTNSSNYVTTRLNNDYELVNNATNGFTCYETKTSYNGSYEFSCENCNSNDALRVTRTNDETTIKKNSAYVKEDSWYTITTLQKTCTNFFKKLLNYYFAILGLFIFIFLLKRGLNWFGRWFNNI